MHVGGITCHLVRTPTMPRASVPADEGPRWQRRARGIQIQPIHRRNEFRKPTEAHAGQLAGFKPTDRGLGEATSPGEVTLGPADARAPPLDHGADHFPTALKFRISFKSLDWIPRHGGKLPRTAHPGLICPPRKPTSGRLAAHLDAADVHRPRKGAPARSTCASPGVVRRRRALSRAARTPEASGTRRTRRRGRGDRGCPRRP